MFSHVIGHRARAVLMTLALSVLGSVSIVVASSVDLPLHLEPIRARPIDSYFVGADLARVDGGYYLFFQGTGSAVPGAFGLALDGDGLAAYPTPLGFSSSTGWYASQVGAARVGRDALVSWTSYEYGTGTHYVEATIQSHADWLSPSGPVVNLGEGMNPAIASTGYTALVAWSYESTIRSVLLRLSSWPTVPAPVSVGPAASQARPAVAWAPEARAFLVCFVTSNGAVTGRLVDATGALGSYVVIGNAASDARPSVSWDGEQFVVAWGSGGSVLARRVSSSGEIIDPNPIEIGPAMWPPEPRSGSRAGETMIVWADVEPNVRYRLRAARLDPDGNLLDPGGFLIYEAPDRTDPGESRVESVLWDGARYLVTWLHGYWSCGGLVVPQRDIMSVAIIPTQPPVMGPATLISGFAEQRRLHAVALGDYFWTTWNARDRSESEIVGARWACSGESLDLLDPAGISLRREGSCYPIVNIFTSPVSATAGSTALTAWRHWHEDDYLWYMTVLYQIHDIAGQRVRARQLELRRFPRWSDPVVAASSEHFFLAYPDDDLSNEQVVYWRGIDQGGEFVGGGAADLGTDEMVQDATSNGSSYLLAWTVEGDSAFVGRFDADYVFVDPSGLFLAITSGGDDALRVASDGDAYLAVWDEAGSLRGARVSPAGVILDPGGFEIARRQVSAPFDLDWDGYHYIVAWIDSDGDALLRVQRVAASGEVVDPVPAEVLRRTDSLQWCSVASRAGGQSLVAATTGRNGLTSGHGVLYWNPAIVAIGPETTPAPVSPVRVVPNPFRMETALDLGALAGRASEVRIMDAHGRVVWRLLEPRGLAHRVRWDGRGLDGDTVPPGIYFYEISSPGLRPVAGKVVKLR